MLMVSGSGCEEGDDEMVQHDSKSQREVLINNYIKVVDGRG